MVLRGPHIPDSPGTGSVSVFFVDPRGEPSARERCLELIWIWLGLYFLFSSPDSRYVINDLIMSINVIPVAKPRPKVDFTFSGNMSFGNFPFVKALERVDLDTYCSVQNPS